MDALVKITPRKTYYREAYGSQQEKTCRVNPLTYTFHRLTPTIGLTAVARCLAKEIEKGQEPLPVNLGEPRYNFESYWGKSIISFTDYNLFTPSYYGAMALSKRLARFGTFHLTIATSDAEKIRSIFNILLTTPIDKLDKGFDGMGVFVWITEQEISCLGVLDNPLIDKASVEELVYSPFRSVREKALPIYTPSMDLKGFKQLVGSRYYDLQEYALGLTLATTDTLIERVKESGSPIEGSPLHNRIESSDLTENHIRALSTFGNFHDFICRHPNSPRDVLIRIMCQLQSAEKMAEVYDRLGGSTIPAEEVEAIFGFYNYNICGIKNFFSIAGNDHRDEIRNILLNNLRASANGNDNIANFLEEVFLNDLEVKTEVANSRAREKEYMEYLEEREAAYNRYYTS